MDVLSQAELILQGMNIGVPAGEKLIIMPGDTVRVTVQFSYRGTAISCTLYSSIGQKRLGIFDEIAAASKALTIPASPDFAACEAFVDIDTAPISPGLDYDIYAKISEYIGQAYNEIDDVIDVVGAPEFKDFAIASYKKAAQG